jgi:hypothetical protein
MTRLLVLVACLLFSLNSLANNYITVTGEGSSLAEAKENAFREAIQIKIGTIVLSGRESTLEKIKRDDISVYSAGYVTDYKTLLVNDLGSKVVVTLDVLVTESKLIDQTLNTGKTAKVINGDQSLVSINTFLSQKKQADKLLASVMTTYPKNAYTLKQSTHKILTDMYRNVIIEVPYSLEWNSAFVNSFSTAMTAVSDTNGSVQSNRIPVVKVGSRSIIKINDIDLVENTKDQFTYGNELRLKLDIKDGNFNSIFQTCYVPKYKNGRFFAIGDPSELVIFDNVTDSGSIKLTLKQQETTMLEQATKIELSLATKAECQKIKR